MRSAAKLSSLTPEQIKGCVWEFLPDAEHQYRKESIANAVLGVVEGTQLQIHPIGIALSQAQGLHSKHAIKQVDRLLSNSKFELQRYWSTWVEFQLGGLSEVTVALDWTDYDADGHSTLCLAISTHKGRAVPLMWKTVEKSRLNNRRNHYEDVLLTQFRQCVPESVQVTVTADRGFADQKLFTFLESLRFDYVIRIKGTTHVGDDPNALRAASRWLREDGRAHAVRDVYLTRDFAPVPTFVSVKKRDMKDAWYLASSRKDWTASQIVQAYGRRFTIEEMFRDEKNDRFGLGLSETSIRSVHRRDRLLFLGAIARHILTVLGAAGENLGHDRMLKANTSKKRTHSLYTQGKHYFRAMHRWPTKKRKQLLQTFERFLCQSPLCRQIIGISKI